MTAVDEFIFLLIKVVPPPNSSCIHDSFKRPLIIFNKSKTYLRHLEWQMIDQSAYIVLLLLLHKKSAFLSAALYARNAKSILQSKWNCGLSSYFLTIEFQTTVRLLNWKEILFSG